MRTFCFILNNNRRTELIHTAHKQFAIHHAVLSNGCNMAYIDEGSGAHTLVFVHGLATYGGSWKYQIEALKEHYRCIAVDLPGNGYSDRGNYDYSIHFYAGCVYDFHTKARIEKCGVGWPLYGWAGSAALAGECTGCCRKADTVCACRF